MGVSFDLILADDTELEKIANFARFPDMDVISTRILDPVTFAELHAHVTENQYQETFDTYYDMTVSEGSEDGPWIYLLPDVFIFRFAAIENIELRRIAYVWGKAQWGPPDENSIQELAQDMQTLALRAINSGKKVFLRAAL